VHHLLVAKSTPKQKGVADEDDAAGESPDAGGPGGGPATTSSTRLWKGTTTPATTPAQPDTSGTPLVRWPLRAARMLTTPVRSERPHEGREVVARLLRLNDRRSAECEGENASSQADPVGNVASRRSLAPHGDLAARGLVRPQSSSGF
jgi:hypothetical protein